MATKGEAMCGLQQ